MTSVPVKVANFTSHRSVTPQRNSATSTHNQIRGRALAPTPPRDRMLDYGGYTVVQQVVRPRNHLLDYGCGVVGIDTDEGLD
jgi:hypothetical protein